MENTFTNNLMKEGALSTILGQANTKRQLSSALLMKHNVIIVGPPGVGKTTLAKNVASLLETKELNDCPYNCDPSDPLCPACKSKTKKTRVVKGEERFVRVQGSPDLTVEDLMGDIDPVKALEYGPLSIEAFTPGKIFKANNGVLFFDELNRCPEKLQNSLLQVLQEGVATIGSYDVDLPANFLFIGTMNPEDSSTEKLSDVFLDRFDVVYMDHPDKLETEKEIVINKGSKFDLKFSDNLLDMMLDFVRNLRLSDKLEKVPSVRASISLYERAQSNAYLDQASQVGFNHIKEAVISVLSHRISMKPSVKYIQDPTSFLDKEFSSFMKEKGGDP